MWQQWTNSILGLWLILSLFLGLDPGIEAWNIGIVGAVILVLAIWGASESRPTLRHE